MFIKRTINIGVRLNRSTRMRMASGRRIWIGLTVASLLAAGAVALWHSAQRTREAQARLRFNQELLCVALAYHRFAEYHGNLSPRGLADIAAEREAFPQLFEMIQSGAFVVRWNALLSGDGQNNDRYVLGYESGTPHQGGWVLMGGGGRQQVSADEFHALPLMPTR